MPLLLPEEGERELLDKMLRDALSVDETYTIDLYVNDYTPVKGSTFANFTVASWAGYAAAVTTRANWAAASTAAGVTSTTQPVQTWIAGGPTATVYGYLIRGTTSGVVQWAERIADSRVMASGDTFNLTPRMELN